MTGLLSVSLTKLIHVDPGFEADRTITAEIDLPHKSYADQASRTPFYRKLLERMRQLPGVESAGVVGQLPLTGDTWIDMIRVQGDTRPFMQIPSEHFRWVSSNYFAALRLPLIAGRFLDASDQGKRYALISAQTARSLWPNRNPIGEQFSRAGVPEEAPFTVIGVVGDGRTISLAQPDPMMVYMPYWYRSETTGGLLVRTRQDPAIMADTIRRTIWSVDPEVSVPTVRALGGIISDSVANRRFEMDLLLLFAISALFLAGLGVYGVVTYSVVQRRRELGLRLALGAPKTSIYALVLREGLIPVLIGAIAGIGGAFGCARVISSLLFQVSPYNPLVVSASVLLLVTVGSAACLLPAYRAAEADPMQALRAE
jgi:predicted permease